MVEALSIVIPTKNRPADLDESLLSIACQTVQPTEVLVIDQSTKPVLGNAGIQERGHLLGGLPLRYFWEPSLSGAAAARNYGGGRAEGDVIVFMDDDVTLERDCLANLLKAFRELPDVGAIAAVDLNMPRRHLIREIGTTLFFVGPFRDDRERAQGLAIATCSPQRVRIASTYFLAVRRACFQRHKFRACYTGNSYGEDVDFTYRVARDFGLTVHPGVRVRHRYSPVNRCHVAHLYRAKVFSKALFYRSNLYPGILALVALGWAYVGLGLHALYEAVRFSTVMPIKGFCEGLFAAVVDSGAIASGGE